jgi:4-hydroxy-3-methylbut-2-enyl diphosphate reductase
LGLTAGASAPEILIRETINSLSRHFELDEQQVTTANESIIFKLPRELTETAD